MLSRIVVRNVFQRKGRKLLAWSILLVSAALLSSLMTAAIGYEAALQARFQRFGPNFVVKPTATHPTGTLSLGLWHQMLTIFWRHSIVAIVPVYYTRWWVQEKQTWWPVTLTFLDRTVPVSEQRSLAMGWRAIAGGWEVEGLWPTRPDEILVGVRWAQRHSITPGTRLTFQTHTDQTVSLRVSGVVRTGGPEDAMVLIDWRALAEPHDALPVHRFYVRALTVPEPLVPVRPELMTPEERERWFCTPYPSSIAFQLQQVLKDADVQPLQKVIYQETAYWQRVKRLVLAVTGAVLVIMVAGMGVVMSSLVRAREREIALFLALGADRGRVLTFFLVESLGMGLTAGAGGWLLGSLLLRVRPWLGLDAEPGILPEVGLTVILITTAIGVTVTVWAVLREIRRFRPAALHEIAPV